MITTKHVPLVGRIRKAMARMRGFRRNDDGQVLILTGIMVLVAMIMAVTTVNSGYMIYNRIQAQNAVDAAADSFAAYQARGLNFAQHLNDVHYWANWTIFGLESANYFVRVLCPLAGFITFPFYNIELVRACCIATKNIGLALDNAQNEIAKLILTTQEMINTTFPVMGGLSANALAEANGADKVLQWSGDVMNQLAKFIGMDASEFNGVLGEIADSVDIYVVPLNPGQLTDLNIKKQDPPPDYLPWDDLGIIGGLVFASDLACLMVNDSADDVEPSHDYGWSDTYYCGGPSYNTWLAGKKGRNVWPALDRLPWLNPTMGTPDLEMNVYTYQDGYPVVDQRGNLEEGQSTFKNPAFFVIASSQVGGSPLMERSSHSNFKKFAEPELISVHVGNPGSDTLMKSVFIWH